MPDRFAPSHITASGKRPLPSHEIMRMIPMSSQIRWCVCVLTRLRVSEMVHVCYSDCADDFNVLEMFPQFGCLLFGREQRASTIFYPRCLRVSTGFCHCGARSTASISSYIATAGLAASFWLTSLGGVHASAMESIWKAIVCHMLGI